MQIGDEIRTFLLKNRLGTRAYHPCKTCERPSLALTTASHIDVHFNNFAVKNLNACCIVRLKALHSHAWLYNERSVKLSYEITATRTGPKPVLGRAILPRTDRALLSASRT